MDVETDTSKDWAKDVDNETPSRLSLITAEVYNSPDNKVISVKLSWS